MRTTACLLVLATALLIVAPATAAVHTVPFAGVETQLTLVGQQRDLLRYEVGVGELVAMDVETQAGTFTRLMIPGFFGSHREGAPELPMMNRLIELPYGAAARVEIISQQSQSYSLADLGIVHPIFPAQPSMPKSADPATWPFIYDPAAYEVSRMDLEVARVEPIGHLRGVRVGRLEIAPVELYPQEGRIVVHTRMEVVVHFDGGDETAEGELKVRTRSPFFEVVYGRVEGGRSFHENYPDRVRDIVTMVVITPPEFSDQMQPFCDWKTTRGFHTIKAVTGVDVGTTKEAIQAYIHDLYNNPPNGLPAPSFVLFVGDVAQMPTWSTSNGVSDRPYCAVDGDLMPDIYYGRFSATNPTQLQAILDKTLMYDQFTMPDPSYLGEVVMIAGMDGGFGQIWANGQINYGTSYYFNTSHGIYSYTHLYPQSGSQDAQIVQEVSEGVAYVNYTAHGSQTSWSDPTFTQTDVNNLQNYGEYCTAVGNCCLTSTYDYPECFAETWLRAPGKGAIGYIGGSNSTYWDEDYYWGVGYQSIIEHPPLDPNHMGAYDGVFHDQGAAMPQWYVTNDAIIFCGNLAVTESGSSRITYYWNIYNLMGDPSISTYLGVPAPNPVVCPQTVFTTWSSLPIEAAPGSYVGLTQNGTIVGAGTVDETGSAEIEFLVQPLTPGPIHLVVMAQNHEPYVDDLACIVPATVFIDPQVIEANVETEVSVGVFEYDGITPKVGVEVWADGLDYETAHAFTDETGYCVLTINYPYGPSIAVCGQVPGEPWELFRNELEVQAGSLFGAGLSVTTEIGLNNAFALNLPGTIHATVSEPGHILWAFLDDEPLGSTTDYELTVTPTSLGTVTGIIAVSGFDLFTRAFPVIEAYGTLTGHVDADGSPAVGAVVRGLDDNGEQVFEVTTNSSGNYDVGEEILVAPYTITCDLFGWLHWESEFFLNYGPNSLDIELEAAPAGMLSGTVTDAQNGDPLEATVKVYRADNGDLYDETTSGLDGTYEVGPLPYFEYEIEVRAWHHMPLVVNLVIDEPNEVQDFQLEPTNGNLLIVDDTSNKQDWVPAKVDERTGEVLAPGYLRSEDKSVQVIVQDLENMGYAVDVQLFASTNPATWPQYDLLLTCSGNNITTLNNATVRANLITYVQNGGRLLIEGGEVGYDHYSSGTFAAVVLRINDWDADNSGSVTVYDPDHYVMSVPNQISGPIDVSYSGYGDEDALDAANGGVRVGSWTNYSANASIICYDDHPEGEMGGQIVFFAFNYGAMATPARSQLLENAVTWLLTPDQDPTGVEPAEPPSRLSLMANRPNPVETETLIRFALPEPADVRLKIYEVTGRRVALLAEGTLPAGFHDVVWSGRDDQGRMLPSGVYFYRMETEGRSLTRKLTIIR